MTAQTSVGLKFRLEIFHKYSHQSEVSSWKWPQIKPEQANQKGQHQTSVKLVKRKKFASNKCKDNEVLYQWEFVEQDDRQWFPCSFQVTHAEYHHHIKASGKYGLDWTKNPNQLRIEPCIYIVPFLPYHSLDSQISKVICPLQQGETDMETCRCIFLAYISSHRMHSAIWYLICSYIMFKWQWIPY